MLILLLTIQLNACAIIESCEVYEPRIVYAICNVCPTPAEEDKSGGYQIAERSATATERPSCWSQGESWDTAQADYG